jgi:heme exporter protein B
MTFLGQAKEIARVDLRVETRLGETMRVILPFAVVSLIVVPLALGPRLALISSVGFAVFWALGVLFGMQIALRQSANDTAARRDLYALVGVDPAARFLGRTISGTVLMSGFLVVLFLAMLVLYNPELPPGWVGPGALSGFLFAVGLCELATLAGEVASGLRNRTALASLIVAPLSLPFVIGASQALAAIGQGAGILSSILLLTAAAMALGVVGMAVARPLEESGR